MSSSRIAVPVGLAFALALIGCNQNQNSGLTYVFSRPEHLEFACFAPHFAPRQDDYVTLPRACCETFDLSRETAGALPDTCKLGPQKEPLDFPRMHVFITQSTRGEIAAVDLGAQRVLDSDRLVPGFTFLDSGGLPAALVVPAQQPRSPDPRGPVWTYVASAEERQVRAIPTCRFRSGRECGPDLEPVNADVPAYTARTRVPLPGAPNDMLLGPDGALWVSLPSPGVIARVELAETPLTEPVRDAFMLDSSTGKAREFQAFGVPVAAAVAPKDPVAESDPYLASCGLGNPFTAVTRLLPNATPAPAATRAEPTRMRLVDDSGLLLVADRAAPVLHAFQLGTDGSLTVLGALPTGAPVRDFAVTPSVPVAARSLTSLPPPDLSSSATKRYLYAIDDRDGSLMTFEFVPAMGGALPRIDPLLAPAPGTAYADRISIAGNAMTLDVIDTRSRSDYTYLGGIDALRAQAKLPGMNQARDQARVEVFDIASAQDLRGVFVVVASMNGALSVLDVHDLDMVARAEKSCTGADLVQPKDASAFEAVAVRRHAVRRDTAGGLEASVADSSKLIPINCAPEAREMGAPRLVSAPGAPSFVCVPADPWSTLTEIWTVQNQGTLPGSSIAGGAFVDAGDPQRLILQAPPELNLCERGVEPNDLVAVTGRPLERLERSANCPVPSVTSAVELDILEARADELVLTPHLPSSVPMEDRAAQRTQIVARLRECYPDLVGFELRAGDLLVRGTASTSNTYLHRQVADRVTNACVPDATKDPRITSRPRATADGTYEFENPYVAFKLRPRSNGESETALDTSVTIRNAAAPLAINLSAAESVVDALPTAVRYVPELGDLFVLDTASQGLRRYTLRPFQRDNDFKPR